MTEELLTRADRFKKGKTLRHETPRESLADLRSNADRDPVAILAESDATRVPELLPVRYGRMMENPFAFLRGAAAVMAFDLAQEPKVGIPVQACGDCHVMNFGAFVTPENNILFDINDFDETLPGVDFTVDLKRLAASAAVAALASRASKKTAHALAAAAVEAYRRHIIKLAGMSPLEIWHSHIALEEEIEHVKDRTLRKQLAAIVAKVRGTQEEDDNFPHLANSKDARIKDKPPLIYHLDPNADAQHTLDAKAAFTGYRQRLAPERAVLYDRYVLKDLAFKVVGVGSVGTFCAVGLFMSGDAEPMFLQIKEAQHSALERLAPDLAWPGHQGERVVEGQRMMQAASDIFLGWTEDPKSGRQYYVRQLKNRRLGSISELAEEDALADYVRICGRTLARAHARTGDPAMIAGYAGKSEALDEALASFAMAYADRTIADHLRLVEAKTEGGLKPSPDQKAA
jgi:uncharacterized protein (DUF2252 family)